MRLIVGLGNPGARYQNTPHNVGFVVCDRFAEKYHMGAETRKFQGQFRRGHLGEQDIGILKPQTYMNLSGQSVAEAVRYLPLEISDIILVFDDLDLGEGRIRIRPRGGSGGHRGVQSVIDDLGTEDFSRLRVGVGRPARGGVVTRYLLGRVCSQQRGRFLDTADLAVGALEAMLEDGVDRAMNRYNGLPAIGQEEEEAKA